jgi:hypothetical protein
MYIFIDAIHDRFNTCLFFDSMNALTGEKKQLMAMADEVQSQSQNQRQVVLWQQVPQSGEALQTVWVQRCVPATVLSS